MRRYYKPQANRGPEPNWKRWSQIIKLLAEGLTNQEIADHMGVKHGTVNWYIGCLMRAHGLYGSGDSRRLIVLAVKGKLGRIE